MIDQRDIDRIFSEVCEVDGCWFLGKRWMGIQPMIHRHTTVRVDGVRTKMPVHKAIYLAFHGPVPDRHVVRHLCGWGGCCKPEHLGEGTQSENMLDDSFHRKHGRGVLAPLRYS